MKLWVQGTALVLALTGIGLLSWPRRDVVGVFLGFKWRELIGFAILGIVVLLVWRAA